MATLAENLQTLNETKQAIKTAIENKGQDLTDVPFTEYAEKIAEIKVGGIIQPLIVTESGEYVPPEGIDGYAPVTVNVETYFDYLKLLFERPIDRKIELTIPNGIKELGYYAIGNWFEKNKIYGLSKVNLNEVEIVGNGSFQGNQSLVEVNAPNLTMLAYDLFYNCLSLIKLHFPNVISAIDSNAFRQCENLKVVKFDKIETLEGRNFQRCYALDTLIIATPKVCILKTSIGNYATCFEDGTARIYVPDDLVDQYKVATNWVQYADMIKPLSEYVEVTNG